MPRPPRPTLHGPRSPGGPCHILPPHETAAEHVRNALMLLRAAIDTGELAMGNEGWSLTVSIKTVAGVQARLEAALDRLSA